MQTGSLSDKCDRFCRKCLVDFNTTQAAILAGYNPTKARAISSENLTKPYIKAQLAE